MENLLKIYRCFYLFDSKKLFLKIVHLNKHNHRLGLTCVRVVQFFD